MFLTSPARQRVSGSRQAVVTAVGAAVWLGALAAPALAGTFILFDRTFTRATGRPAVETFTFPAPQTNYLLRVESDRVASAIIVINGRRVVGTSDFNANVTLIERPVELQAANVMTVELRSQPGSTLRVILIGEDNDPPVIRATPSPPANSSGWNNTDVGVTFACEDAISGVASCQAPLVVSTEGAGQVVTGTAVDVAGNRASASLILNIDKTPPVVRPVLTPMPNAAGWNKADVTVAFECADALSGVAQCSAPALVTAEGAGQQVAGGVTDVAGNAAATTALVNLDKTTPTIVATPSVPSNEHGWNNTEVSVTFTCGDALSGVASCPEPAVVREGGNQVIPGTVIDVAGNAASTSLTVSVDVTPLVINAVLSPAPNAAGWNNADVTVSFECSDAGSGVLDCPPPQQVTADGAKQLVTAVARDRARNSSPIEVSVSLDKTPPTISAAPSPPANAAGWHNVDATVSFSCEDGLSGVAECSDPQTVTAEGASQIVPGRVVDVAGNTATTKLAVSLDKTAPEILPSQNPPPNPSDWNNTPVTVGFTCSDALSGVASCPTPSTIATEGAGQIVAGTAVDQAGNSASASATLNIDRTPPTLTPASSAPGAWSNTDVTVTFTCADGGSGVSGCPDPHVVSTEGANQTVTRTVTDRAGNASEASLLVNIDRTPPVVTATPTPSLNSDGWASADVTVTFECTDSGSGVAECPSPQVVAAEGADQVVAGTAVDVAGNNASTSLIVNLDKTPPTITPTVTPPPNASGWHNGPVTVSFACEDGLSGVAACPEPVAMASGDQNVIGAMQDRAGNSASAEVRVRIDTTPPSIRAVFSPPPNEQGWHNADVTVSFECADSGSGVAQCPTAEVISAEGANQPLTVSASDLAGNAASLSVTVNLDRTAPQVVIAAPANGATLKLSPVAVTGTITETGSGPAALTCNGVALPSSAASFTCELSLVTGPNAIVIEAVDIAGNAGRARVDVTYAPNRAPTAHAGGPYNGVTDAPIQFDGSASIDPDNDTLTFAWDFGDGQTATGRTPIHTYASAGPFTVTLTVDDGRDGSDQTTASVTVSPASLGRGLITGRAYNDANGLPIEGAMVQLVSVDGEAPDIAQAALSDARGRFRLSSPPGLARMGIVKEGFTSAERSVQVVADRRVDPFDARLTPLDGNATFVSAPAGGTARNSGAEVTLAIPPGVLSEDRALRLTRVTAQGLMGPLPLGWSPAAVVDVSPGGVTFGAPASLGILAPAGLPGASELLVARWDEGSGAWIALGSAGQSADGKQLLASVARSGQYAFLVADPAPDGPPSPAPGQPVDGVLARAPPPGVQVTITPSPRILFAQPGARSTVGVLAAPSVRMPSGTPLRVDVTETFGFANGARLHLPAAPRHLALYSFPASGASLNLRSSFAVSPSRSFAPFALKQGVIDLAARLPADPFGPRGKVIGAQGGELSASTGERIVIPAGAAGEDLPVLLARLEGGDFPVPGPTGFSLLGAVIVDLHGAPLALPASLSIPAAGSPSAGTTVLVVELVEVDGVTHLALVALGAVRGGELVTVTDPKGDGSLRLPGIRGEGRYAFLSTDLSLGFVSGLITGLDGSPLAGALVSLDSLGIVALGDSDGRYVLAAPLGDAQIRVLQVDTDDTVVTSAKVETAGGVVNQPFSLSRTPPAVVSVSPPNGAQGVPLATVVSIAFSEPIDPASVAPDAVLLTSGGTPVAGSFSLAPGSAALTFRPSTLLASHTTYQVTVAGAIRDPAGNAMGAPFGSQFTTVDVTPPPPPPAGAIGATIPDASGTFVISGTQGTADPGGVVIVENVRTGALTTLTPNADGSFSGTVAAARSDRLELTIRDAAKNETTVPVPAFANPDGSVVVGSAGGRVEGAAGAFVDVPPGALPDGTVVKVEPLAESQFAIAAPSNFPFIGGLRVDLGGVVPLKSLDLGIPAPSGATPQDQVLVAHTFPVRGGHAWTVVDRAHLQSGRYQTASPPFVGAAFQGSYAFLSTQGTCVSYVTIHYQFGFSWLISPLGPFLFPVTTSQTTTTPAVCDSTLAIHVLDPDTNQVVQQITEHAPTVADEILDSSQFLTDDHKAPILIGASDLTTYHADEIEVRFSEPMNADSLNENFTVEDSEGNKVGGTIELREGFTVAIFRPDSPFRFGEQYSAVLYGVTDLAGNFLEGQEIKFTPFKPRSLSHLGTNLQFRPMLEKCRASGGCSTSVIDEAYIANTLFMANGLRFADEQYTHAADPKRLVVVDVGDPFSPTLIGFHPTRTNPRTVEPVPGVNFFLPNGESFSGDMLLVAGGGRVPSQDLPGKLEIYGVSSCTQRPVASDNCLDPASPPLRHRFLSSETGVPPRPGVPPEAGIPLQMAVLHEKSSVGLTANLIAYVLVPPIGIEAVNVLGAFNLPQQSTTDVGPDGLVRGNFLDVAVLKNRVLALERIETTGESLLSIFDASLTRTVQVPLPGPAARVAAVENLVFDIDADGNLGVAEDEDQDSIKATDEIFDLAVVSSGPLDEGSGCALSTPCGELYILDLSSVTNLAHSGPSSVVARIPLRGPAFGIQVDRDAKTAYVEIRGHGLGIADLGFLRAVFSGESHAAFSVDDDGNGQDDRVLRIIQKQDILMTDVRIDATRGVAYINGSTTGVELLQISNNCSDLLLDFRTDSVRTGDLTRERNLILDIVRQVRDALVNGIQGLDAARVAFLEQGSGSCFWRGLNTCRAFTPGSSDHDIEVFLPMRHVKPAQGIIDAFLKEHEELLDPLGDFTMFAMPREPVEAAELLNGTPMNQSGDASGDLAMGRQSLLLLWILEGGYVDDPTTPGIDYDGGLPTLEQILAKLKTKSATNDPVFKNEPTGIPRLEGYEWSVLQEFNFYKSGATVRIKGACEGVTALDSHTVSDADPNDPALNMNETSFLGRNCQEELRTVAKAAIRTVFARLVAHEQANSMLLEGRRNVRTPAGDVVPLLELSVDSYRRNNLCVGVEDPFNPPSDPQAYRDKPCESFEEFIMSMAVESVRRGHNVFSSSVLTDSPLPWIYRFSCVKVGANCPRVFPDGRSEPVGFIIRSDAEANELIAKAIRFIEESRAATQGIYNSTITNDDKQIKTLVPPEAEFPFFNEGPKPGSDGIVKACEKAGVAGITLESTRGGLRRCNEAIVSKKVNGASNITIAPVDVIAPTATRKVLEKAMGVKRYVKKNLRVRAINRSPHTVPSAMLVMYEGDGQNTAAYEIKREKQLTRLEGSASRVVATEPDPDNPGNERPVFPTFFDTAALQDRATPGTPRAIVFFLDPNREIPEQNKKDNQKGFFYYILDRDIPAAVPPHDTPAFAIDDTSPDELCLERPPIEFDLTAKAAGINAPLGVKELNISVSQQALLTYRVKNRGTQPLQDFVITKNGQPVFTIEKLLPGGSEVHIEPFIPTATGTFTFLATVTAATAEGDSVGPEHDRVVITATPGNQLFDVQLFDHSPLRELGHPFSRFLANHDDEGKDIPLLGAVTDGDQQGGGGRLRILIGRLKPGIAAEVSIADGELANVSDGIGSLEHGDQSGVLTLTVMPDIFGEATVFYTPPAVFVRPQHRAADLLKEERRVKLTVKQNTVGARLHSIALRRPPVFLVHGLLGTRDTWNKLQPLVPAQGLAPHFRPVRGFGGRFDVFGVGTPFASRTFAEEAAALKQEIRLSLGMYLPGFSIGKVDVVAHSMGGILTRRLVNELTATAPADSPEKGHMFRKLITVDTPFLGSPLADKIAEIRDELPDKLGLRSDYLNPEDGPPSDSGGGGQAADGGSSEPTEERNRKIKIEMCAATIFGAGLTPRFSLFGGALDDLKTDSDELKQLAAAGIRVPSHHIIGATTSPATALGIGTLVSGLWTSLGLICNLTPDANTIETTNLVKVGAEAVKTLLPILRVFRKAKGADRAKELLKIEEKVAKRAKKLTAEQPKPVFTSANDRIVPEGSQVGGIPAGGQATTFVSGAMDHNQVLSTEDISDSTCIDSSDPANPRLVDTVQDFNGDGALDVTCRVIHLLEADPHSNAFFQGSGGGGPECAVDSITGPCVVTVNQPVTLQATGERLEQVSWSAPGGDPSIAIGPSFTVNYITEGDQLITAMCGSTSETKRIAVAADCSTIQPELIETEIAHLPSDHFGEVLRVAHSAEYTPCVDGGRWCFRLARYRELHSVGIMATSGQTAITGPDDKKITPDNCYPILQDLTPPPGTPGVGPSMQFYWVPFIVLEHEQLHVSDFRNSVILPTLDEVSEFVRQASHCTDCQTPVPQATFNTQFEDRRRANIVARYQGLTGFDHEIRAHGHSNNLFEKLVGEIRRRAREAPAADGWPDLCK